ncbi:MAG: hypothetical protein JNM68_03560 [Dinghuibacter sp.]|nr:hypothetical protein [Dinghuibacter sp.]
MKNTTTWLAAALIALCSCGGGTGDLKADIESTEKLRCERKKLREKISAGDSTLTAQYEKIKKELDELEDKMRDKYKDKMKDESFREKAGKYAMEARKNCN